VCVCVHACMCVSAQEGKHARLSVYSMPDDLAF